LPGENREVLGLDPLAEFSGFLGVASAFALTGEIS